MSDTPETEGPAFVAVDPPAAPAAPEVAGWLVRARAQVAAFRTLGVDVPAISERLARAEAADAAGNPEAAEDLCDEVAVLTALVRREVVRAVGARLPADADQPVAAEAAEAALAGEDGAAAPVGEPSGIDVATLDARIAVAVEGALRVALRNAEDTWRSAIIAELEAKARDQAPAGVGLNELRKEIATALEGLRDEWQADVTSAVEAAVAALPAPTPVAALPAPTPVAAAPAGDGPPVEISEAAVPALAASAAFKELLEERFQLMLRYLKDDVLPREIRRVTEEAPKPAPKPKAPTPKPKKKPASD